MSSIQIKPMNYFLMKNTFSDYGCSSIKTEIDSSADSSTTLQIKWYYDPSFGGLIIEIQQATIHSLIPRSKQLSIQEYVQEAPFSWNAEISPPQRFLPKDSLSITRRTSTGRNEDAHAYSHRTATRAATTRLKTWQMLCVAPALWVSAKQNLCHICAPRASTSARLRLPCIMQPLIAQSAQYCSRNFY